MELWRRDDWPDFHTNLRRAGESLSRMDDRDQIRRLARLRELARSGTDWRQYGPEVFSQLMLAWQNATGMTPYEVQLRAGCALCDRKIVEMETGEGKSLTATFPLAVHGLRGRGAWLVTANDYLAGRDADMARRVLSRLGLSVGAVLAEQPPEERRTAYACDVTYGTAKEFGFDFLRDRLKLLQRGISDEAAESRYLTEPGLRLQRMPAHVVVDEADHILVDEARTPLILSGPAEGRANERGAAFRWAAEHADQFREDEHFLVADRKTGRGAWLTESGRALVRKLPGLRALPSLRLTEMYEFMERAIRVRREYIRNREYIVDDGKIVIIDEGTGRPSPGRQWAEGIHQAVEAGEGVAVSPETETLARATIQEYFGRFPGLSGMTGTILSAATEVRRAYRLRVTAVPTRLPSQRIVRPARVFSSTDTKWDAVAREVAGAHATNRPVLVGTRRIDDSHAVARRLDELAIPFRILNASQMADEAAIVAEAGLPGQVTIATNMAGRGTDIRLGPGVPELGGLLVLVTELHDTERIDRQLAGRCARQGDPGEVRVFLSVSDELLRSAVGAKVAKRWIARAERQSINGELPNGPAWWRLLKRAQRKVERKQGADRYRLVQADKVRREVARSLGRSVYAE